MKVIVNEQPQRFWLAFKEWKAAAGHEIKVDEFRFCAIPVGGKINVTEITTGMRLFNLAITNLESLGTKESTLKYFKEIGIEISGRIKEIGITKITKIIHEQRKLSEKRLGKMPPIENLSMDELMGQLS